MNNETNNTAVPKLRFPEFREAWAEKPLEAVLFESRIPSQLNDPRKRITVRLSLNGVEKRDFRGTEAEEATYFFTRKKGQFIYGKQNLHKGAFGLIPDDLDNHDSSQDLPAFDFAPEFSPKYFLNYLGQDYLYPSLEKISTGTGSKRIHPRDFLKVKFLFPSLPEQQKIAAALTSLDDLLAAQTARLAALQAHKRGLMQQLFPAEGQTVPERRFPAFQEAGEWAEKTLGELIEIKGRIGYRGYTTADIVAKGEGAISLSPSNISEGWHLNFDKATFISWDKYEESPEIMLRDGFTVLVKTGSTYGKAALVSNLPEKTTINPQVAVLKPTHVNSIFLYLLVSNSSVQNQIEKSVVGGAIPTLSQQSISNFDVLIPNEAEQQKIAACLTSLDDLLTAQTQKIAALKRHKQGLMQGLFPAAAAE